MGLSRLRVSRSPGARVSSVARSAPAGECLRWGPLCQRSCRPDRISPGGVGLGKLARYGQAYKDRIVARLLPPESSAVDVVSREVGGKRSVAAVLPLAA